VERQHKPSPHIAFYATSNFVIYIPNSIIILEINVKLTQHSSSSCFTALVLMSCLCTWFSFGGRQLIIINQYKISSLFLSKFQGLQIIKEWWNGHCIVSHFYRESPDCLSLGCQKNAWLLKLCLERVRIKLTFLIIRRKLKILKWKYWSFEWFWSIYYLAIHLFNDTIYNYYVLAIWLITTYTFRSARVRKMYDIFVNKYYMMYLYLHILYYQHCLPYPMH